mmetsp:Transcript_3313/g.4253  ORF Transcript_3313/g.4253 Transcript_3313/m.4253 type:complete len:122 (-) Transcript_3313:187-552(-)
MATGRISRPYTCDQSFWLANATIATAMLANVTVMCIQAKNVRSFAKNTFGSIFTGTFLGLSTVIELPVGPPLLPPCRPNGHHQWPPDDFDWEVCAESRNEVLAYISELIDGFLLPLAGGTK